MTSEREAFEKHAQNPEVGGFKLSVERVPPVFGGSEYKNRDTQIAWLAWQAARQDWPSEDEAVEIMLRAYLRHPDATLWKIPDRLRVAYRALLAATPAPKGVE